MRSEQFTILKDISRLLHTCLLITFLSSAKILGFSLLWQCADITGFKVYLCPATLPRVG